MQVMMLPEIKIVLDIRTTDSTDRETRLVENNTN